MNKKLKVLHILSGFGVGGAEIWLLELIRCIKINPEYEKQLQVDFLLTGGKKQVLDDQFEALGIKLYYITFSLGKAISFRKNFIKLLRAEQYDALHSHQDFVSGWIFGLAAGYLPPKRISYLHNSLKTIKNYLSKPHRYFSYYAGKYLMYFFSTHISGTSKAALEDYGYYKYPFKKKNIGPIYCGIDTKKFILEKEESKKKLLYELDWGNANCKIALFIGRIDLGNQYGKSINPKNPEFAFKIAVELVEKYPEWNFLFVGKKGNKGNNLEKEVELLGLEKRIKFLGIRSDIPEMMNAADILIFPSLWEGLGMVAIEAQASGLPVLASENVPGEACVVTKLYYTKSLTVSYQDWVQEIISITQEQYANRDISNKIVSESGFSIQNSLQRLINVYSTNEK